MNLHQKISYEEFLSLLVDYYKNIGISGMVTVDYLHDYAKAIYSLKQFVILDESDFITWACLNDENEKLFVEAEDSLFNPLALSTGHNLWIIDGKINPRRTGFIKAWHREYVPRFDRFKCLLLNKGVQKFREVSLVKGC